MSSTARPLLNLGDVVRDETSSSQLGSPPVNVPRKSRQPGRPFSSVPQKALFRGPVGYGGGSSPPLVAPVMDEGDVILSSSASSSSSSVFMQRHKDAANWGVQGYGSLKAGPGSGGDGGGGVQDDFTRSGNLEDDGWEKLQARNDAKRQQHTTT